MTELKLDPEQFGQLGSSFFLLFSISAIVVGFIVNSVATRWAAGDGCGIWSLQFPMVGTVSFTTLLICRIILGAGEGPVFGGGACDLQMVSTRSARCRPRYCRKLGRRDPRGASA